MTMDYQSQKGRMQFWLLRVLEDLRTVNLYDTDFLSAIWEGIEIRFPEGFEKFGDEIWRKPLDELTADAMEELVDYFIYSAVLYDRMTPRENR